MAQTPERRKEYYEEYCRKNRAKILARNKARYFANHETEKQKRRDYYQRIKHIAAAKRREPKERARMKAYNKMYCAKNAEVLKERNRRAVRKMKTAILQAYGPNCACCGSDTFEFLSLDHTRRNGYEHRKQLGSSNMIYRDLMKRGFPQEGYRILCMNCNHSRGMYGYCPHNPELH